MAVRLDQLPPLAKRPARPRVGLWLAMLPLFVLSGIGLQLLMGEPAVLRGAHFWVVAIGIPMAVWGVLSFVRALNFFGQHRIADGWDEARETQWLGRMRRGRRLQQVLAVSLHTALRGAGDTTGTLQMDALLGGGKAFKAQPCRLGEPGIRYSRLGGDADRSPEKVVLETIALVLADLAPTLLKVSANTPLALLLEVECSLPQASLERIWQQAWGAAGIRQPAVAVEGSGLSALDQWLDQRIMDPALLLVVAVQIAPLQPEGKAEAAVGVLLGNRLMQTMLAPIAYLHRPEQEHEPAIEKLHFAARQALDWVPLAAQDIEQVWRAGIDAERDVAINTVLSDVALPAAHGQQFCHLDALLGQSGKASPWLAIAAATQTIASGAGPQFIFSGDSTVKAGLWSTVVMPAPPLSE